MTRAGKLLAMGTERLADGARLFASLLIGAMLVARPAAPARSQPALLISAFMIMALLEMPFTLYHTFVIEERFGFNKTTPKTYVTDLAKGFVRAVVDGELVQLDDPPELEKNKKYK